MSRAKFINDFVRRRVRQFRVRQQLPQREVADRAQLPVSSYACMEAGFYEFRLDNLFRILAALEIDISEVWSPESYLSGHPEVRHSAVTPDRLYVKRLQEFRMNELIMLAEAEGAALFSLKGRQCQLLFYSYLSETFLERLQRYLLLDQPLAEGLTYVRQDDKKSLVFFLKAKSCPPHVKRLMEKYLVIWSTMF